jgi:hypothetical protein
VVRVVRGAVPAELHNEPDSEIAHFGKTPGLS